MTTRPVSKVVILRRYIRNFKALHHSVRITSPEPDRPDQGMEAYRPLGVNDRAELRSVRRRHARLRGGRAHRCRPTWFTRIGTSCNLMLGSHSQIGADDYDRYRAHP